SCSSYVLGMVLLGPVEIFVFGFPNFVESFLPSFGLGPDLALGMVLLFFGINLACEGFDEG
ncbi:3591_t:CDS:2, partial [Gigaspora rosea]